MPPGHKSRNAAPSAEVKINHGKSVSDIPEIPTMNQRAILGHLGQLRGGYAGQVGDAVRALQQEKRDAQRARRQKGIRRAKFYRDNPDKRPQQQVKKSKFKTVGLDELDAINISTATRGRLPVSSAELPGVLFNGEEIPELVSNYLNALDYDPAQAARHLEIDFNDVESGTGRRIYTAFPPNEHTARRIAPDSVPRAAILGDVPFELPFTARPVTAEDIAASQRRHADYQEVIDSARRIGTRMAQDARDQVNAARRAERAGRQTYQSFLDEISQFGEGPASPGTAVLQKEKLAGQTLEVFPTYYAEPADSLTRVSVAEGRSRLIGDFANFPYDPITPRAPRISDGSRRVRVRVGRSVYDERRTTERNAQNMQRRAEIEEARKIRQAEINSAKEAKRAYRNRPFNLSPEYMARYEQLIQPPPEAAQRVASGVDARMGSSVAERLADDTMRAASVIHSSKLGFAAIGTAALGAAFGITSLRSRNDQRKRGIEQG